MTGIDRLRRRGRVLCVAVLVAAMGVLAPVQAQSPKAGQAWTEGSPRQAMVVMDFAVYLDGQPKASPVATLRALHARLPAAPQWVDKVPTSAPSKPTMLVQLVTDLPRQLPIPSPQHIAYFGRGLDAQQAAALQASKQALLVVFFHPGTEAMARYRPAMALLAETAAQTGGTLWDGNTREAFSLPAWRESRLQAWEGAVPLVRAHTVIHAYKAERGVRAITLGMNKFGMPDVVVDAFAWSDQRAMGNLLLLSAQRLVEGQAIGPGGRWRLDVNEVRHAGMRAEARQSLIAEGSGRTELRLVGGRRDEGDPDNALAELSFDGLPGADHAARQHRALARMYGSGEKEVRLVRHDAALKAASERARAQLPALREAFRKGLAPGEFIQLKAPFATDDGGTEWMWVEVLAWEGDRVRGLLKNEPRQVARLQAGQEVTISQKDVFDYWRFDARGQASGNETGKLIDAAQRAR